MKKLLSKLNVDNDLLLQAFLDIDSTSVIVTDLYGKILLWNKGAEAIFGYTQKEAKGKLLTILNPEIENSFQDKLKNISNGQSHFRQWKAFRKDGEEVWIKVKTIPLIDKKGIEIGFIGISTDITAEKKLEQELKQSQEYFKNITENIPIILHSVNRQGKLIFLEGKGLEKIGLKKADFLGKSAFKGSSNLVFNTDKGKIITGKQALLKVFKGETISGITFYNGSFFSNIFSPKYDIHGKVVEMVGISVDITERMKIEEALKRSETRYKRLMEKAPVGIVIHVNDEIIFANKAAANIFGIDKPHKLIGTPSLGLVHEDYIQKIKDRKQVLLSGKELQPIEIKVHRSDGAMGDVEVVGTLVELDGILAIQSIFTDINDRKEAINAIKKNEEKLNKIAEAVPGIIWQIRVYPDGKQVCEFISSKVLDYSTYTPEEIKQDINRMFEFVIPEDFPALQQSVFKAIQNQEHWQHEYRIRDKFGRIVWMNGSAAPENSPMDNTIVYYGFLKEITERKRAEQELRDSHQKLQKLAQHLETIRDDEKKRIAMEIHDELGQNLTSIKLDLFWLKQQFEVEKLNNQEKINQKIDAAIDLTGSVINTTRRIAHELRPVILDNLGLVAAIEWQVGQFQDRTGIRCNLQITDLEDLPFNSHFSSAMFRVVQESLNNISKHASATEVDIHFYKTARKIRLEISDNGIGFDKESLEKSTKLGIFGIRERINAVSGELIIKSSKNKGTKLEISVSIQKTVQKQNV